MRRWLSVSGMAVTSVLLVFSVMGTQATEPEVEEFEDTVTIMVPGDMELVDACRIATVMDQGWEDLDITWDDKWTLTYYNNWDYVISVIARGDTDDGKVVWADCEVDGDQMTVLSIAPGPL